MLRIVQQQVEEINELSPPVHNVFNSVQSLRNERAHTFQNIFKYIRTWQRFGFAAVLGDGAVPVPSDILRGRSASVCLVSWSADGGTIATGSTDGTVQLFCAASGDVVHVLEACYVTETPGVQVQPNERRVHSVTWSADGNTIATLAGETQKSLTNASRGVRFELWNARTGRDIPAMYGPVRRRESPAVSPDGEIVATKSDDGTVRLWGRTGRRLQELRGHTEPVTCLAWNPNGSDLVTGAGDVRVWDILTGTERHVLRGHTHSVCCVAFNPAGTTLATGSLDETARLWDVATGECVSVLWGHTGAVVAVAWSPGGDVLATASDDHTARLWYPPPSEERSMQFVSDVADAAFPVAAPGRDRSRCFDNIYKLLAYINSRHSSRRLTRGRASKDTGAKRWPGQS